MNNLSTNNNTQAHRPHSEQGLQLKQPQACLDVDFSTSRSVDDEGAIKAGHSLKEVGATISSISSSIGTLEGSTLLNLNILQVLEANYPFGRNITDLKRLNGGVINDSFLVTTNNGERYFVRGYAAEKQERWVDFEHALIGHLTECGYQYSAQLVAANDGTTYVRTLNREGQERFFMVTTLLEGECPYSHEKNDLKETELTTLAQAFAQFHNIGSTLKHSEFQQNFIPDEARMFRKLFGRRFEEMRDVSEELKSLDRPFARLVVANIDFILKSLSEIPKRLSELEYRALPHLPVHHDLHPGNAKFRGGVLSGIFDFDFAKVDARIYDVGLAAVFLCSQWCPNELNSPNRAHGKINLTRLEQFLRGYHDKRNFLQPEGVRGLEACEIKALPEMMKIGAGFLIHWFINDYKSQLLNGGLGALEKIEAEYTECLAFRINALKDITENQTQILATTMKSV